MCSLCPVDADKSKAKIKATVQIEKKEINTSNTKGAQPRISLLLLNCADKRWYYNCATIFLLTFVTHMVASLNEIYRSHYPAAENHLTPV